MVVVTETWLSEEILDAEVSIKGFNIIRSDRSGNIRGGVCIYIRCNILAQVCLQTSVGLTEALVVKVKALKLIISVVYKSQLVKSQHFIDTMSEVTLSISAAQTNVSYPNILGFGDYNFPNLSWDRGLTPPYQIESVIGSQINAVIDIMNHHLLHQIIRKPTRLLNILDLVFTNNDMLVKSINQEVNIELTDHNTLSLNMTVFPGQAPNISQKKDYYQMDIYTLDMRRTSNEELECGQIKLN